jgi:hypothetical protein
MNKTDRKSKPKTPAQMEQANVRDADEVKRLRSDKIFAVRPVDEVMMELAHMFGMKRMKMEYLQSIADVVSRNIAPEFRPGRQERRRKEILQIWFAKHYYAILPVLSMMVFQDENGNFSGLFASQVQANLMTITFPIE